MKKSIRHLVAGIILFAAAASSSAATYYVSASTGKNKNAGTSKDAPFKGIWKALDVCAEGDTINVAEGNYTGQASCGFIVINKPVKLIGGYSADFSKRDPLKFQTSFRPSNEMNATSPSIGTVGFDFSEKPNSTTVFDGFIIDQGEAASYHPTNGKPAGVESGMWLEPPAKGNTAYPSLTTYALAGKVDGNVLIQNCTFVNTCNYALNLHIKTGKITVKNNVFVNCRMMAANVMNDSAKPFNSKFEFCYNTVMFTWTRTKTFEDMGYAVRANTGSETDIHHNIIGCSMMAGFDNSKNNRPDGIKVSVSDNKFFLNKRGDISYTVSPSVKYIKVDDEAYEDLEDGCLKGVDFDSNESMNDVKAFKGIIDSPYLDGFLNCSYKESVNFDANSEVNQMRAALGLNKQGTISSSTSMFANHYPVANVHKFFGAVSGYGAQSIK